MSKYEEAIKVIRSNYPTENYTMLKESLDLAVEVLEKQIPQNIIIGSVEVFNGIEDEYYCPRCNWATREYYCPNCSQKINWS